MKKKPMNTLITPADLLQPYTPPHLSASSVSGFLFCSARFYFEKVLGLTRPPSIYLAQGSAVHKGIDAFHKGENTTEAFLESWKKETGKLKTAGIKVSPDSIHNALSLLTAYERDPLPPGRTEIFWRKTLSGLAVPVLGYYDYLSYSDFIIGEHKTADNPWPKTKAWEEYQWRLYTAAFLEEHGRLPSKIIYSILSLKPSPALTRYEIIPTEKDAEEAVSIANAVLSDMQAGKWKPSCPSGWCSFEKECKLFS